MKKIFAIGGLSESGKSSVGKYMDTKGIPRLKFVAFYKEIMEEEDLGLDFEEWQDDAIKNRPQWLWKKLIEKLKETSRAENMQYCAIESLYDPSLADALKQAFGSDAVIVFVGIPQKVRLQRQIIRRNLSSIEEAEEHLLPRDGNKVKWGGKKIEGKADAIIDNSGSLEDLYRQVDEMIAKYCPELSG